MDTTTFGVSFLIRKCKANKKRADIYARITIDGDEKEFSTKEQISVSTWDSGKSKVKGNSVEVKSINEHLDNIMLSIKNKYRKLLDDGRLVTAETVRDAHLAIQAELKGDKLKELLAYYKEIWELKLKNGGFKNYKTTIKYLERIPCCQKSCIIVAESSALLIAKKPTFLFAGYTVQPFWSNSMPIVSGWCRNTKLKNLLMDVICFSLIIFNYVAVIPIYKKQIECFIYF